MRPKEIRKLAEKDWVCRSYKGDVLDETIFCVFDKKKEKWVCDDWLEEGKREFDIIESMGARTTLLKDGSAVIDFTTWKENPRKKTIYFTYEPEEFREMFKEIGLECKGEFKWVEESD